MSAYAALQSRDFRFFLTARTCIIIAIQIQMVVVGWQVYQITHDEFSLGLIGLAEAVPAISVALYAGHLADTIERKKIILVCSALLVLCCAALAYFAHEPASFIQRFGATPVYSIVFVTGFARGFLQPANFSFMPQLVSREHYTNAVTWYSTMWEGASVIGPALGGFLIKFYGIEWSYMVSMVLMACGFISYGLVRNKPLPPVTAEQGMIEKIKAGLKFVFSNQIILAAISLDMFAVLFGGAVAMLPAFATKILHAGPDGFGLLRAAPAMGAVSMAIFLTYNPIKKHLGRILLWCVAGFGLCMIGFGLSTFFWLSFAMLIGSGVFDCVSVIIRGTLIHTLTPENMKGRVGAVNSMFVGSSNEIGQFESGAVAKLMGLVQSVVFGGFMTLLVVAVTAKKADKLVKLDKVE
jgi:MFS family permease